MTSQTSLIAAIGSLGFALQTNNGFYDEAALAWLTISLVLCTAALITLGGRLSLRVDSVVPRVAAAIVIAIDVALLLRSTPAMYLQPRANLRVFAAGVIVQAACVGAGLLGIKWLGRVWFPMLLVLHVALGIWTLRASPSPKIDVVVVHREAIDAMASGRSPYAITFENIYGPNAPFYNPDLVRDERVMFGYPYPPLSLLFAAPGRWLATDYRYAELVCWTASAALIGSTAPGLLAKLAAALVVLQPRGFFVLEQGWNEPSAVLMFALTVFVMTKRPTAVPWISGLLLATKQYLAVLAPLVLRFAIGRPEAAKFVGRALLAGALVTLPFLFWNARAFVESAILLQLREPFRADSLSYLSWAARYGWGAGSLFLAIAAAVAAVSLALLLTPNDATGFAAAAAFTAFVTFAFGSKAFCNYYFFVAAAMSCVVAAQESARLGLTRPG